MASSQGPLQPFPGDQGDETAVVVSSKEPQQTAETAYTLSPSVTEDQKHLWQELQESEERFRTTFEQGVFGIAHIGMDGRWLRVNQKFCDILGYTKSELNEQTFQDITFAQDAAAERPFLNQLLSDKIKGYTIEKRYIHKNGIPIWVNLTISLATTIAGTAKYYVAIVEDLQARKQAETEQAEWLAGWQFEQREMEEILRQMPGGIVVAEPTGFIRRGNQRIREILRRPPLPDDATTEYEEWVGYHADGTRYLDEEWPMARALWRGEVVAGEDIEFLRGDGTKGIIRVGAAPLKEKDGTIVAAVTTFYDISEYKELERRKDEFISMASHELKTPITTIKAFAQFLQRMLDKQGLQEPVEYLAKMDGQINKLTKLIADLLDISKIQAGKLALTREPFDFDALVKDIVEDVQQGSPDHTIYVEGTAGRMIEGDKDRLGQVLINLLTNAVKYSPGKDRVDVKVAPEEDRVVVSVQDHGVGIPKQHQDRIFERFYRVYSDQNKTYPGLGIGLYISYEITKRHGGDIWLESAEGQGSTFYFAIPYQEKV